MTRIEVLGGIFTILFFVSMSFRFDIIPFDHPFRKQAQLGVVKRYALKGDKKAQNTLAGFYLRGDTEYATTQPREAFNWFLAAAEQGYAPAQHNVAYCFETGTGCINDLTKAVEWYEKAVSNNNTNSLVNLGLLYLKKEEGFFDPKRGISLLKQSADLGDIAGIFNYAAVLLNGEHVAPNKEQAIKYLKQAADAGCVTSQSLLEKLQGEANGNSP